MMPLSVTPEIPPSEALHILEYQSPLLTSDKVVQWLLECKQRQISVSSLQVQLPQVTRPGDGFIRAALYLHRLSETDKTWVLQSLCLT